MTELCHDGAPPAQHRTLWPAKKAAAGWDGLAVPGTLELPSPPPPPPPATASGAAGPWHALTLLALVSTGS